MLDCGHSTAAFVNLVFLQLALYYRVENGLNKTSFTSSQSTPDGTMPQNTSPGLSLAPKYLSSERDSKCSTHQDLPGNPKLEDLLHDVS